MHTTWTFHTAGQLVYGPGAVAQLGGLAKRREVSRLLIVTDSNLVDAGVEAAVRGPLEEDGVFVDTFAGGEAEPSIDAAWAAADFARTARPDAVLGLGGGSNMDLAKITALLLTHGGRPSDYFGFDNVPGPVLPLFCVPTTAGTGSEVSHSAVLTDAANEVKVSTLSNHLRPAVALVDPVLTYGCPKQVTADSGIDALAHAVEAYTATDYRQLQVPAGGKSAYAGRFPLADVLAEKAIELVGQHLITAVDNPQNGEARDGMALAATLAGMAFSNAGVALVHALEYPLGGKLHCSHGAGNGMLLPYVMRFNLPERVAATARIAALLGLPVAEMSDAQAAESAICAVEDLKRAIGIPEGIRDLGGTREQLPDFARKTFAIERLRWINPRPTTEQDLLNILERAF